MMLAEIVLGSRGWLAASIVLAIGLLLVVVPAYRRGPASIGVRLTSAVLKSLAVLGLAACLVEPLWTGTRPRPGSNLFLVLADNSRSMQLADGGRQTRGQNMLGRLSESSTWMTRLGQDFDVRRYAFDSTLQSLKAFETLPFDGQTSSLATALDGLAQRYRDRPVAGILVFTDGIATDLGDEAREWKSLPPVFPVPFGSTEGLLDLSVSRVAVSQTNFDAAPVTIAAEVASQGITDRKAVVRVLDETGKELERKIVEVPKDAAPIAARFLVKPEKPGVSFYTVHACLEGEETAGDKGGRSVEATLANNRRFATVDRGGGPYRILYVSGRPNWEFKFLNRALASDEELKLVGLIRIARKEPKFTFLGSAGERTNPLFRGFGNEGDEEAEQYDQPVLIRLTDDEEELRGGFPKSPDDLYRYHAIILDDMESAFFTQDQMSLIQQFVSKRGGSLLMLGGKDSFADGGYARTPVADLLPVYVDRSSEPAAEAYRLKLTREGWLQPWVRVRTTEPEEEQRLASMPNFKTLNAAPSIKPGASTLAEVEGVDGATRPALVVQSFGRGRGAALLIGDLWLWQLHRRDEKDTDLERSWRQTVRWLVSDVPKPVDVELRRVPGAALPGVALDMTVRDKLFEPLDNAAVNISMQTPDKRTVELTGESAGDAAGKYLATVIPREPGIYRATVTATASDGSEVGRRETGWAIEPETEEFRTLAVNQTLLADIAEKSGGEMIDANRLDQFVAGLPNRKIPVTESWTFPLWHRWQVFAFVAMCLLGEWGLRRWKGMA